MAKQQDNDARREEFINAAEKLFKENGVVETTINAIVKEVDVAKGLFYYYFKSKDDVIDAISAKYKEIFENTIAKVLEDEDFDTRLDQYIQNVIESFDELKRNLDGQKKNIDLTLLASRSIEETKEIAAKRLESILQEGINEDKLNLQHPEYYAKIIIGGIVDLVHQDEIELKDIQETIMNMITQLRKE